MRLEIFLVFSQYVERGIAALISAILHNAAQSSTLCHNNFVDVCFQIMKVE